jgi:hypothetical protein
VGQVVAVSTVVGGGAWLAMAAVDAVFDVARAVVDTRREPWWRLQRVQPRVGVHRLDGPTRRIQVRPSS